MVNKDFDVLKNWMFGSLSSLLDKIPPNPNLNILKMSIGEPQLGPPKFIRKQFDDFFDYTGKYPPSEPIPVLKDAIRVYLNQRFIIYGNRTFRRKSEVCSMSSTHWASLDVKSNPVFNLQGFYMYRCM